MIDIRSLEIKEICELSEALGEKAFRGKQISEWLCRGASSFGEMTNLPASFRAKLEESCRISGLEVLRRLKSKDGTQKFLYGLDDGNAIETVFMKYKYGNSICISSQAGCRMGCVFCASGKNGLSRDLTPGEMAGQIQVTQALCCGEGERISHVVVMGTGEPFDNYENVRKFVSLINQEKGLGIGHRNITISTCGIVPRIADMASDMPQVNLAISLHAPNDAIRRGIMPIANKYPVSELIDACRSYAEKTHRRVTFEYAVTKGVNDSDECIRELASLLRGMLCHVNLIPLNPIEEGALESPGRKRAEEIREMLESLGIPATVRRTLGSDIDASCGQLRLSQSSRDTI